MPTNREFARDIIAEQLNVDKAAVVSTASFRDDLGADSLDSVELTMALEEGFEIEIPDDEAGKLLTVQDLMDYLQSRNIMPDDEREEKNPKR